MKFNWKASLVCMSTGLVCGLGSYIAGHATCAHQHVTAEEQRKMIVDENGNINQEKYIKEAFKDFYKMRKDPLGLEVELN